MTHVVSPQWLQWSASTSQSPVSDGCVFSESEGGTCTRRNHLFVLGLVIADPSSGCRKLKWRHQLNNSIKYWWAPSASPITWLGKQTSNITLIPIREHSAICDHVLPQRTRDNQWMSLFSEKKKNISETAITCTTEQIWANYGPGARYGPFGFLTRPAKHVQIMLLMP